MSPKKLTDIAHLEQNKEIGLLKRSPSVHRLANRIARFTATVIACACHVIFASVISSTTIPVSQSSGLQSSRESPSALAWETGAMGLISFRCKLSIKVLFATLFLSFLEPTFARGPPPPNKRVLLSEVDTLTLYSDRTTEYRRTVIHPGLVINLVETISSVNMRGRRCYEIWIRSRSYAMQKYGRIIWR